MKKVFGTDGIRGKANKHPMTPEMCVQVGKAVALYFRKKNNREKHRIVIGKDTRLSGYMIESALTAGIISMGVDVLLVGPMPTPAVSHLTKSLNCDAGIVISASHNPAEDNGIKIFDTKGYKLSESIEAKIEELIFSTELESVLEGTKLGKAYRVKDARGRYIEFTKQSISSTPLNGLKIVLDCANGAAYSIAPSVFSELGAKTIVLNDKPNGLNINKECGALHPELICKKVKEHNADFGIALDGDADRLIVCDELGNIVDGDQLLAIFAIHFLKKSRLENKKIIATQMSNLGLDIALKKFGIKVERVKVGDKYVMEAMRKNHAVLGGEQSGHIIFKDYSVTGDGIISALQLAAILQESGKKLSELSKIVKKNPQVLINVPVKEKKPFEEISTIQESIEKAKKELSGKGRVLVRYSGTEKLARIMIEGKNEKRIKKIANQIALAIKKEVGE